MIFKALLASIMIHLLILIPYRFSDNNIELPVTKKVIKLQLNYTEAKNENVFAESKKLILSQFGISEEVADYSRFKLGSSKDIGYSRSSLLLNLIEQNLIYPKELAGNGIQGSVLAKLVISKEGRYLEHKTKLNSSSRYLKVLVARTFRKTFNHKVNLNLKKISRFTFKFKFTLSTSRVPLSKTELIDESFYFYRQAYGVSTKADMAHHIINKALVNSLNLWSFTEYLPESEKSAVKRVWKLSNYRNDPMF